MSSRCKVRKNREVPGKADLWRAASDQDDTTGGICALAEDGREPVSHQTSARALASFVHALIILIIPITLIIETAFSR
jgi:hypothetical protein